MLLLLVVVVAVVAAEVVVVEDDAEEVDEKVDEGGRGLVEAVRGNIPSLRAGPGEWRANELVLVFGDGMGVGVGVGVVECGERADAWDGGMGVVLRSTGLTTVDGA